MSQLHGSVANSPSVSVVVVAFNMQRELPRTLRTLSPQYQVGIEGAEYEVIVVDNGSNPPIPAATAEWLTVLSMSNPSRSPAAAANTGLSAASGDLVGMLIDGARMASPGLVRHAQLAACVHPRAIVATLGFHLGPDAQMSSLAAGYTREVEDDLLKQCGWEADGYRLFEIAAFAGSSAGGWFKPLAESNALFMRRGLWQELNGFDERFQSRGGGLVNLDVYERACTLPDSQLVIILGEATFHQVHGGLATNAPDSPWDEFHREYVSIRGHAYQRPVVDTLYVGRMTPSAVSTITEKAPAMKS